MAGPPAQMRPKPYRFGPSPTRTALMLAPALLVLGGLFLGGMGTAAVRSLGHMPVIGLIGPDLEAYRAVLASPVFLRALAFTLWIAVASTVISAVIAVGVALLLRQTFRGRAAIGFLVQVNLTVPHLVGAIGILYLFSQSGSFARLGHAAGLIARPAEFPALVFDPAGIGIILQYVWKEVPFIALILLARLRTNGAGLEETARTLGASRWQAFRHVTLPALSPALAGAMAIVFAFAFGAYEVPLLLGPSAPVTLPVLAWRSYTDVDLGARPEAMAMAVVIAAVSGAAIWAARRGLRGLR